ncbi:MAG: hypothetical protein E5W02_16850, partial [Mesorhizobium sp.]
MKPGWKFKLKHFLLASTDGFLPPKGIRVELTGTGFNIGRIRQAVFSSANLPAAIAVFVLAICALFVDQQNRKVSD